METIKTRRLQIWKLLMILFALGFFKSLTDAICWQFFGVNTGEFSAFIAGAVGYEAWNKYLDRLVNHQLLGE